MHVTKTEMPSQGVNPAMTAGERLDQLAFDILEQSGGKMLTKDHREDYIRLKGGNPETARTGHYKVLGRLMQAGKIIEYAGYLYAHTHAEYSRTKSNPGIPDTSP